jgi:acyl-CoA reductase-like NAD-dependent aldehyde dehydrogenase
VERDPAVTLAAPPEATRVLEQLPTQLFVGGHWREADSGERFEVIAPFSEQTLARVAAAGEADIDAAVLAARAQVDGGEWSHTSGSERRQALLALADLIERDVEILATLEALDCGKPLSGLRGMEIPSSVEVLRYYAGWADKIDGRQIADLRHMGRPRHSYTVREPFGVIAAITPWNAPLLIAIRKLAPALAAGNALVLKPSEDAPLSQLHLAKLIEEIGLPPGVVSVVPGFGAAAGAPLVRHPGVDKVSFTGSPEAGAEIGSVCGRLFRSVTLELGGKSPQIILADADLDAAIAGTAAGLFTNAGQMCAAGSRVLVQRGRYEEVVERLAGAARAIRVGGPFEPDITMGPLINQGQVDRVLNYVERGRADGAELVAGGTRVERPGYFVEPAIFSGGRNEMTIAREEIFGPVGLVIPFDDPLEAAAIANDSRYGLAAYIWTRDLSTAHTLARAVSSATVWVNGFGAPDARLPWGGMKASGLGRELSYTGLEEMTQEKAVSIVL